MNIFNRLQTNETGDVIVWDVLFTDLFSIHYSQIVFNIINV